MLKISLNQLADCIYAFNYLLAQPVNIKVSVYLINISSELNKFISECAKAKDDTYKGLGLERFSNRATPMTEQEYLEAAKKDKKKAEKLKKDLENELAAISKKESAIEGDKISVNELGNIAISAVFIEKLSWLLK